MADHVATNGHGPSDLKVDLSAYRKKALIAGVAGLGLFGVSAAALSAGGDLPTWQIFASYSVGFMYWVAVTMGALFLVSLQYLTGGKWGILMRRPFEAATQCFPLLIVFFIPVAGSFLAGKNSPYPWAQFHHEYVSHHEHDAKSKESHSEEEHKEALESDYGRRVQAYSNPNFSIARAAGIFLILGGIIFVINRTARKAEENPDENAAADIRHTQRFWGTWGIVLYALCGMILITDWVMSYERFFASSMFPLIFHANAMVSSFALALLVLIGLRNTALKGHYHPSEQIHLGSFMLAMALFWVYTTFSQFMLIWAGNLPEELGYPLKRASAGWQPVWWVLLAWRFFLTFGLLLFREVKSNAKAMRMVALGLMTTVGIDIFMWIEPTFDRSKQGFVPYWVLDIAAILGLGGIWVWYFLGQLSKYPVLPVREIYLLKGHHDESH